MARRFCVPDRSRGGISGAALHGQVSSIGEITRNALGATVRRRVSLECTGPGGAPRSPVVTSKRVHPGRGRRPVGAPRIWPTSRRLITDLPTPASGGTTNDIRVCPGCTGGPRPMSGLHVDEWGTPTGRPAGSGATAVARTASRRTVHFSGWVAFPLKSSFEERQSTQPYTDRSFPKTRTKRGDTDEPQRSHSQFV